MFQRMQELKKIKFLTNYIYSNLFCSVNPFIVSNYISAIQQNLFLCQTRLRGPNGYGIRLTSGWSWVQSQLVLDWNFRQRFSFRLGKKHRMNNDIERKNTGHSAGLEPSPSGLTDGCACHAPKRRFVDGLE